MRLALSMVSIFLGISFFVGTLVFTSTINRSFDDLFTSAFKNTDALVQSTKTTKDDFGQEVRQNIPRTLVEEIKSVPGVSVVEGNIETSQLVVLDMDGKRMFSTQGPPTLGSSAPRSARLTPWRLVGPEGNNLSAQDTVSIELADSEVLVDKSTADAHDLALGDTLKVVGPVDVRVYAVKGFMRFGTADGSGGVPNFFFNEKQAGDITGQTDTYSSISVGGNGDISQDELAGNIESSLAKNHGGEFEAITGKELIEQTQKEIKEFLTFFTVFLLVFALIALFVALIIIINSFAIIMTQRKREYALLRAIGATPGQIRRSVFGESIVVGFVASAFGVLGGIGLTIGIKKLMELADLRLPEGPLVIPPTAVISGIVIGTLATFVSAFFPAWGASRVAPIEALRETAFEKNRRMIFRIIPTCLVGIASVVTIFLGYQAESGERLKIVGGGIALAFLTIVFALPLLIRPFTAIVGSKVAGFLLFIFGGRRAFGITGEIARRNNVRNPRRSARTALALMFGVALVVFISVFVSSATATFSNYLKQAFAADIIVGDFNSPASALTPTRCAQIDAEKYIKASSCVRTSSVFLATNPSSSQPKTVTHGVNALNTEKLTTLFSVKYSGQANSLGKNGVAIPQKFAEDKGISLGDTVRMTADVGESNFVVKAILDEGLFGPFDDGVVIDTQGLDTIQTIRPSLVSMVVLNDGVKPAVAQSNLENLLVDTGIEVNDLKTSRDQQIDGINSVLGFVYGLLALAIVIASIGILNTMSLSILERRRELGLMRAVGTTKSQVRGFVRFESIILSVLGTSVGLIFGVGAGFVLVRALKEEGFTSFYVNPVTLIVILGISAFIGVAAGAWPAWRATKVDVLKAVTVE